MTAIAGLVCMCACGEEPLPRLDPAQAILDGAARAVGAPVREGGYQIFADATVEGPDGTFRTSIYSASDGRVRMEQTPSGFQGGVGRSGGWRRLPESGRVDSLGAGLALVRGHELHMLALAPRTRFEGPRLLGNTEVKGRPVMAVALSLPTGDSLVAYFDAVDTVPVGARVLWTDPPVEVDWGDWFAVDGVRLFGRATFRQGPEEFRYRYDSVHVSGIQDSVYEPPGPREVDGGRQVAGQPTWLKGNVHVHTDQSDGASPPPEVVDWYRTHGYAFLFITDHNLQTVTAALKDRFDSEGEFLLLPGVEVTDRVGSRPVHLNGLGVGEAPVPAGGPDVPLAIRGNAEAIRSAGGVAVLNHPNGLLSQALSADDIARGGVRLFEVCCADFMGGSGHPSTDQLWDEVLASGEVLYGIAADDAHDFGRESRDPGSAWIMVRAGELTGGAILESLRRGDFYATTGVGLIDVQATPERLCLQIDDYDAYGFRTHFIGRGGEVLSIDESEEPCFEPRSTDLYVRARVQRSDGALAWVQPVFPEGR